MVRDFTIVKANGESSANVHRPNQIWDSSATCPLNKAFLQRGFLYALGIGSQHPELLHWRQRYAETPSQVSPKKQTHRIYCSWYF